MKKLLLCLALAVVILLTSCGVIENEPEDVWSSEDFLRQLEHEVMMAYRRGRFLIDSNIEILEDGTEKVEFFEGKATQRMIDMYNYILRNLEPQVLFNDRDIVMSDIFENTLELNRFWGERDMSNRGLLSAASSLFLGAWFGGYIDHDDVDGCWRGHTEWSYKIWR